MSIIEIKNIMDLMKILVGAKLIGMGETSYCFRLQNGVLLKIYRHTAKRKELFSRFDMVEKVQTLNRLKNDTYIGPDVMLIYKGKVIGYIMPYIKAKTLYKLNLNMQVESILENLEKLIEDTHVISKQKFRLGDLHNRNILFNGFYYVIDLDFGYFSDDSLKDITSWNISDIMKTILETLFCVKESELLKMDNENLFQLYNDAIYCDYRKIYEFFGVFKEEMHTNELTIRKLQKSRLVYKEENTYYRI